MYVGTIARFETRQGLRPCCALYVLESYVVYAAMTGYMHIYLTSIQMLVLTPKEPGCPLVGRARDTF